MITEDSATKQVRRQHPKRMGVGLTGHIICLSITRICRSVNKRWKWEWLLSQSHPRPLTEFLFPVLMTVGLGNIVLQRENASAKDMKMGLLHMEMILPPGHFISLSYEPAKKWQLVWLGWKTLSNKEKLVFWPRVKAGKAVSTSMPNSKDSWNNQKRQETEGSDPSGIKVWLTPSIWK